MPSLLLALPLALPAPQETDVTQAPNAAGAGIQKSYGQQVGPGRGDVSTPGSSAFLIARDPFRAVARGRQLFQRKFTHQQGLGPRTLDGQGDLGAEPAIGAGLADSCAACHGRPQGSAGFGGDVFTRRTSRDAPHLFGLGLQEMLADEVTRDLRRIRERALARAVQQGVATTAALRSKGIDYGALTAHPDGTLDTSAVRGVDADLRVRPFFAQGGTASIREFLVGAFDAEMGLEAHDPDLLAAAGGSRVVTPAGMELDGARDVVQASPAQHALDDPDGDGVVAEVPEAIVDYLEFYLLNYFRPAVRLSADGSGGAALPAAVAERGRQLFVQVGCASCHVPDLAIERDRRVADVETALDPQQGNPFNNLFAVATPLFDEVDDGSGLPTLKVPRRQPFVVRGFYADLKRHDLGPAFWEESFDGSVQREFVTEPLWGVGSTAPYGHDGRSPTLEDVILRHGGEAQAARDAFAGLDPRDAGAVLAFLDSLVLFSPPATASNLRPKDPLAPDYPLQGHGSIDLGVLFVDPLDRE